MPILRAVINFFTFISIVTTLLLCTVGVPIFKGSELGRITAPRKTSLGALGATASWC